MEEYAIPGLSIVDIITNFGSFGVIIIFAIYWMRNVIPEQKKLNEDMQAFLNGMRDSFVSEAAKLRGEYREDMQRREALFVEQLQQQRTDFLAALKEQRTDIDEVVSRIENIGK